MVRALPFLLFGSLTLLPAAAAQAQFSDDFSDLDLTTGVVWSGNTSLFSAATGALQSQSAGAANYYLSTPSALAANAQWEFYVNLKFSTSGANYADVYLMSDVADLSASVNGYYVRIGGTADRVELFRSDAGTGTSLVVSPDGIVNSSTDNPFRIKVTRGAGNGWTLFYDDGAGGTYATAGSVVDATYAACSQFGVRIEQSSAVGPVNNHFFDDFVVGPIVVDLTPPALVSATAVDATHVDLLFDEPIDASSVTATANYSLAPAVSVLSAEYVASSTVHLNTAALTENQPYTVTVNNVMDLSGNVCVNESVGFTYLVAATAQPGDVVINELMSDPSPTVGLPDAEFVELYNTTTQAFDLANWTITDGSTTGVLPSVVIPPNGYVIVTDDANAALFTGFGTVVPVASFPSLNNDGDPVTVQNAEALTIDEVTYALSWYNDIVKALGGWTLERKDPVAPCSNSSNWSASIAPAGGTPGAQNSIFSTVVDAQAPALISVFVTSATQIELQFSEAMNVFSLAGGNYAIDPLVGVNLSVPVAEDRVALTLSAPLTAGQLYTITVTGVTDCPGNAIGASNTLPFALPDAVNKGDVVINEVLYDPRGSGSDFVELYNRSQKVLSLAGWKLANETDGVIGSPTVITASAVLLLPGQYVLIAENSANILSNYPLSHTDRFLETDMPSYNNGEGVVVLQDALGDTLDRFAYSDDLHFPLLNNTEGVSLERVSPDRPTDDNSNWHSAAEAAGSATPGYVNSQFAADVRNGGTLSIDPAIFSPDNDGYQDLLTIGYTFDAPGYTATMKVFDIAGREVVTLMNNELLGTAGSISWNGIMETGDVARMGPYVVYLEAFAVGGDVRKFRETVVLAHKLD